MLNIVKRLKDKKPLSARELETLHADAVEWIEKLHTMYHNNFKEITTLRRRNDEQRRKNIALKNAVVSARRTSF